MSRKFKAGDLVAAEITINNIIKDETYRVTDVLVSSVGGQLLIIEGFPNDYLWEPACFNLIDADEQQSELSLFAELYFMMLLLLTIALYIYFN